MPRTSKGVLPILRKPVFRLAVSAALLLALSGCIIVPERGPHYRPYYYRPYYY